MRKIIEEKSSLNINFNNTVVCPNWESVKGTISFTCFIFYRVFIQTPFSTPPRLMRWYPPTLFFKRLMSVSFLVFTSKYPILFGLKNLF